MQKHINKTEETNDHTSEQLLLTTKLAPPPVRGDLVSRSRLTDQLQLGRKRPLTLIAAPAGFGKTTLLSTWLEQATLPTAWLSLESDDDDLTRFWSYVFMAIGHVRAGSGTSALALLRTSNLSPPPPIETILTIWINNLALLPDEVALILDDYHLITTQAIHRSLTYLVDHLPHQLHLIIATRADPLLPLARLRTRDHLTEIRAADLRFTAEETAAFLTQTLGLTLSAQDIAALEARTEGWIAGLQLAALSMRGCKDIPGFLKAFTGSHRYIIDYLIEEVLARQSEQVQSFLLQTAFLERLQGSLCEAVMGKSLGEISGQAMLEQLEQANLFVIPLDEERLWYRYHQLFAETLCHWLRRKQPNLIPEIHRRASIWYEQQGLLHDAVHHALAIADFELAVRLMEQAVNSVVSQGEIMTLQRWVAALPKELVGSHIQIAVWQGWLLFVSGQFDVAERHLQEMEQTFSINQASAEHAETIPADASSLTAIRGRIASIRASIAIVQGDFPRTIALSRLALEYLPKEYLGRAYAAWYLGKAHWLSGDLDAASIALTEASHISWEVNHIYALLLVTYDLANLQIRQGRLHHADQTCRQTLQQVLERDGQQPALGPAYVVRGSLEREWNHLDAATSLLQEGIKLCEQSANTGVIVQAYSELAFIKQIQGDTNSASAMMRQAVQIAQRQHRGPFRGPAVEALQARLSLMQGDEAAASRWVQHCGLSLDQKLNHLREREYLTLVRVLIAQHKLDEAIQWLEKLLQLAETQGRMGSMIEILMLQAEALQAYGEVKQAIERFAQALSLAEPEGYIRIFVDEGESMARLLAQMQTQKLGNQAGSIRYREQLLTLLLQYPLTDRSNEENLTPLPDSIDVGDSNRTSPNRSSGFVPGDLQDENTSNPSAVPPVPTTYQLSEPLGERELEVLRLIVAGYSNREIADYLVIAVSTVKWYVNVIYGKLQVESRTKAIAKARELNIV